MKKILTVALALGMLAALPTTNVFAETQEVSITEESSEGTVSLVATKTSSYTIELPTQVDVASNSTSFNVRAKGDVDDAKQIVIAEKDDGKDHQLADGADANNKVDITVTPGDAIDGADVTADYNTTAVTTVTIAHNDLKAGSYTCSLPITISLSTKS